MRLIVQKLCEFGQVALGSPEDLLATMVRERATRTIKTLGWVPADADVPGQDKVKSIKSQQSSASRARERMIQGIQEQAYSNAECHGAATYRVLNGFGEDDIGIVPLNVEAEVRTSGPSASLQFGPSTSFSESGRQVAELLTLNRRQSIALRLLCRHLDRVHRGERGTPQLCQFVGGEGGTGKSRVIEAMVALFASKGMRHRLLVTATSGGAAARIHGMTIHAACNISVDSSRTASNSSSAQTRAPPSTGLRVDGRS